jgi:uncharacterized protein YciI
MPWFTVETHYTADRERLAAARPAHREYLMELAERGKVLAGGAYADDLSGFVVYRAADIDELNLLLAGDPYTTEQIADRRVVKEWTITLGPWSEDQ